MSYKHVFFLFLIFLKRDRLLSKDILVITFLILSKLIFIYHLSENGILVLSEKYFYPWFLFLFWPLTHFSNPSFNPFVCTFSFSFSSQRWNLMQFPPVFCRNLTPSTPCVPPHISCGLLSQYDLSGPHRDRAGEKTRNIFYSWLYLYLCLYNFLWTTALA